MNRRAFIKTSIVAGLYSTFERFFTCSQPRKPLKMLVLGGTRFVGPSIVDAAYGNDHQITLFNRGVTNPELYPHLRHIPGDREQGAQAYAPLQQEHWDVVIDVWPERARLVEEATQALTEFTDHYLFISSIAVYQDFQRVGLDEEASVVVLPEQRDDWTYAEEKRAAERVVRERFADNHTIVRPGAIKGWRDPAVDLLYWCRKLQEQDAIIAPGSGQDPLQFIDVRDVGRFVTLAAEHKLAGIYNCLGPSPEPLHWQTFLEKAKSHLDSSAQLVWADEAFLQENGVQSFTDLPLWAPLSEDRGFMQISNEKMVGTGFAFTTIEETLDDCLRWHAEHGAETIAFGTPQTEIGLNRAEELALIQKFRSAAVAAPER